MATSGVAAHHHVVKAGWMQRESDVLRRWKGCYCILKTNGMLSYYTDEKQTELQGCINLPRDCFTLKVARDVTGVSPPSNSDALCLIEIRSSQANTVFCAESADDAQTWKLVFDDVIRANRATPNPAQGQQPPIIINGAPPAYFPGPAPPQVVTVNPPPTVYSYNTPSPVTVIEPGSTSRVTSTTYYPNGQTVTHVQRGRSSCYPLQQQTTYTSYPVQQTVYTYPGQTIVPNGNGSVTTTTYVPNQTTTRVYQTRYY